MQSYYTCPRKPWSFWFYALAVITTTIITVAPATLRILPKIVEEFCHHDVHTLIVCRQGFLLNSLRNVTILVRRQSNPRE